MPTTSRPDLLPFALSDTIGLPFHGLVTDGNLELPDHSLKEYAQPFGDGRTILVRGPRSSAPNRSATEAADDTARNYTWQDFALLSGFYREIGGNKLGATTHLYCTTAATWRIRTAVDWGVGSCKVTVYLNGLFGFFPADAGDYSMTERQLAEYTWTPKKYDGTDVSGSLSVGDAYNFSFSGDGSVMLINVGCSGSACRAVFNRTNYSFQNNEHDCIKVVMAGNGSLVPGSIGTGITATITHHKWASDMRHTDALDSGADGDTNWVSSEQDYEYHWVVQPDGSETSLRRTESLYNAGTYYGSDFGLEANNSASLTFGGVTFSGEYTRSSYWTSATGINEITRTTNGTEETSSVSQGSPDATDWTVGFSWASINPYLVIGMGAFKTYQVIAHTGDTYDCNGGETYGDQWSHNPGTGEFAWSATDDVCWV